MIISCPIKNIEFLKDYEEKIKYLLFGLSTARFVEENKKKDWPLVNSLIKYEECKRDYPKFSNIDEETEKTEVFLEFKDMLQKCLGKSTYLKYQYEAFKIITELFNKSDGVYSLLISAPIGFGKTEAFMFPLLLHLKNSPSFKVIFIYPRQTLLEDQFARFIKYVEKMNLKKEIKIGLWYEKIPFYSRELTQQIITNIISKCPICPDTLLDSYIDEIRDKKLVKIVCKNRLHGWANVFFSKDLILRESPNVIFTTLNSLEHIVLSPIHKQRIFSGATTVALVFDEIHLYHDILGIHTIHVLRNIERILTETLGVKKIIEIGASGTIDDEDKFTSTFFSSSSEPTVVVHPKQEDYREKKPTEHLFFILSGKNINVYTSFIESCMVFSHIFSKNLPLHFHNNVFLAFHDSISGCNQLAGQLRDAEQYKKLWEFRIGESPKKEFNKFKEANWEYIKEKLNFNILSQPLRVISVTSLDRISTSKIIDYDIIVSTPLLEVGVDIDEILGIAQIKPPISTWASFTQKRGRGARGEKDPFSFFFLSADDPIDKNIFYKAKKFVEPKFIFPITAENAVIRKIHEKLLKSSLIAEMLESQHIPYNEKLKAYAIQICDEFNFSSFKELILNPTQYRGLSEIIGILQQFNPQIQTIDFFDFDNLKKIDEELEKIFKYINEFSRRVGIDILELSFSEKSFWGTYKEKLKISFLNLQRYISEAERNVILDGAKEKASEYLSNIFSKLEVLTEENLAEEFPQILNNLKKIRDSFKKIPEDLSVILDEIANCISELIGKLIRGEKREETLIKILSKNPAIIKGFLFFSYFLKYWVSYITPEFGESLHSEKIKNLLRSVFRAKCYFKYFENTRISIDEDLLPFIPSDYFRGSTDNIFISIGTRREPIEESIIQSFYEYAPFRTVFLPENAFLLFSGELKKTKTGEFIFEHPNIGKYIENLLIPVGLHLEEYPASYGDAIFLLCPKCLRIYKYGTRRICSYDWETLIYAKSHSTPLISSKVNRISPLKSTKLLKLVEGEVTVSLERLVLSLNKCRLIPQRRKWVEMGKKGKILDEEIVSLKPPIGYVFIGKGIEIDISNIIKVLEENKFKEVYSILDKFGKIEEMSIREIKEIIFHTLSHFFLHLIASVAYVNPANLLYSYNLEENKIYIIERAEGGQGITEMFMEKLLSNPRKIYEEVLRNSYDIAIEAEKILSKLSVDDIINFLNEKKDSILKIKNILEKEYLPFSTEIIFDDIKDELKLLLNHWREYSISKKVPFEEIIKKKIEENRKIFDLTNGEPVVPSELSPSDIDEGFSTLFLTYCTLPKRIQPRVLSYHLLHYILKNFLIVEIEKSDLRKKFSETPVLPVGVINGKLLLLPW
jgi:hypothetical protein